MNKSLLFIITIVIFLLTAISVQADTSFYDPDENVTTNWDQGTGLGFEEIDNAVRQPDTDSITSDYVADATNDMDGVSEFGFPTITETPDNMTLWVYTDTGASCEYTFILQQGGANRCSTFVDLAGSPQWMSCDWDLTGDTADYTAMTIELGAVSKGPGSHSTCFVYEAYIEVNFQTPVFIDWNVSSVDIGSVKQGQRGSNNATANASGGDNNAVNVTELSGNGSSFIDAFPLLLGTITDGNTADVQFNCTPSQFNASGIYVSNYRVNSSEDNPGDDINVTCTVQNAPAPVVFLENPPTANWTSSLKPDHFANFTDEDNTTANCTLYYNNTAGSITAVFNDDVVSNDTSTQFTPDGEQSEGNYTWWVNCSDGLKENKSETRWIYIDATAPVVSILAPVDTYNTTNVRPTYNFSYVDVHSPLAICTAFTNHTLAASNGTTQNNTNTAAVTKSDEAIGIYDWYTNCTDLAGNLAQSGTTREITIYACTDGDSDGFNLSNSTPTGRNCGAPLDCNDGDAIIQPISNNTAPTYTTSITLCPGTYNDTHISIAITPAAFNCNGSTLDGVTATGTAINTAGENNVNILNCNIITYDTGIVYAGTNLGSINNTTITASVSNAISLTNADFVIMTNLVLTGNAIGIFTDASSNLDLSTSYLTGSGVHMSLTSASNTPLIHNNTMEGAATAGISLAETTSGEIFNNTIFESATGIFLQGSTTSINIYNNWIYTNNLANINISLPSDKHVIWNNNLTNVGKINAWSDNDTIRWNTSEQVGPNIIGGANISGNFYDDYTGTDADGDGIGETPYTINGSAGNVDEGPLTNAADGATPSVFLMNPANNTNTSDNTTDHEFNFTDADNTTNNCTLYYDPDGVDPGAAMGNNATTTNNTPTNITSSEAAIGGHLWWVNCTDGQNENQSGVFNITIFTCDNDGDGFNSSTSTPPGFECGTPAPIDCNDADSGVRPLVNNSNDYINEDTTVCLGTYNDTHVLLNATPVTLDCNGSTLDGVDPTSGYGITTNNQDNVTIRNCTLTTYWRGMLVTSNTENATLTNLTSIHMDDVGFEITGDNSSLSDCTAFNFSDIAGVRVGNGADDNTITRCNLNSATSHGINIAGARNLVFNNTIRNISTNDDGIRLSGDNNTIYNNTIFNSFQGIEVNSAENNTIHSNVVYNSTDADNIWVRSTSSGNLIYNNNISLPAGGSDFNAQDDNGTNDWNTSQQTGPNIIGGQDIGGNWYDDYIGNDTDGDGIGEDPPNYTIAGTPAALDFLPLTWNTTAAADTCTPPGSGDWNVTCSDFCNWTTTTTVPGNLWLNGTGTVNLSALMNFTGANPRIFKYPVCTLIIDGGRIELG